jgi:hypothetical protein
VSLVGDALRKARREAAEREVERRGVLFSAHIADRPARTNLGLGLVLGASIALVATVAGGLTVWWLVGRGGEPLDHASAADAIASGARPGSSGDRGAPVDQPLSAPTASDPAPSESGQTSVATDEGPASEPASDNLSPAPPNPASIPATSNGPRPDGFAGREDGADVYILEAEVGGARLSLDFIVFRAVDPFVEINGVELHVGGVVAGFRVKTIESNRVTLTDGRRTIVLRTP